MQNFPIFSASWAMTDNKEHATRNKTIQSDEDCNLECAICLQTCVHPVKLKCNHIYCFLCAKGVVTRKKECPMCRRKVSLGFLKKPNLVTHEDELSSTSEQLIKSNSTYSWFYEGRNGWWEYEERAVCDLEEAYAQAYDLNSKQPKISKPDNCKCELMIAGNLYVIDFELMSQYQKDQPYRQRKIKREKQKDISNYKGVAGLPKKLKIDLTDEN